jgi:hypothetical protein
MTASPSAVRDTSRNSSLVISEPMCRVCARPLASARARYCSAACRQRSFRLRHIELSSVDEPRLRAELRQRRTLVAHTVYECGLCGERSVGQQRCAQDNIFGHAVGLGGSCPECDLPILLADLLDLEVLP